MRPEARIALSFGLVYGFLLRSVVFVVNYLTDDVPLYVFQVPRMANGAFYDRVFAVMMNWFWQLLPFFGGFLLGAVPMFLLLRYRVALPIVLSTLISGYFVVMTLGRTLARLHDGNQYPVWGVVGSPLDLYLLLAAIPLVIALIVVGTVEYLVRDFELGSSRIDGG